MCEKKYYAKHTEIHAYPKPSGEERGGGQLSWVKGQGSVGICHTAELKPGDTENIVLLKIAQNTAKSNTHKKRKALGQKNNFMFLRHISCNRRWRHFFFLQNFHEGGTFFIFVQIKHE